MVRRYKESDVADVMAIWLKGNMEARAVVPPQYWLDHYTVVKEQYLPASITYVEEQGGTVIGFVSLVPGDRYYIGALFVAPVFQGQGTGTRLLNQCKAVWPELELHVFVRNEKAVNFYKKAGFVTAAEQRNQGTGACEYRMVYRKQLETPRLILRPWRLSDAEDMFEYARDGRVGPAAGWKPHRDREETKEIIGRFIEEADTYAMELKETGKVIGSIGLHRRAVDPALESLRQREVGYVLNPAFWGRGYMPEAVKRIQQYGFEELELDLLWCGHFDFNRQSRRVIEKCGFRHQLTIKKSLPLLDNKEVTEDYYNIRGEDYRR